MKNYPRRCARLIGICFLLTVLANAPTVSTAAPVDALVFTPSSSQVAPGQSFSIQFSLTTTHAFAGFSMFLLASSPNLFSVTGETIAPSSVLTDPSFAGSFPVLLSTSSNSPDFGYTSTQDFLAGSSVTGTITLSAASNLPHSAFTIFTSTGAAGSEYNVADAAANPNSYALPQATYTVLAPEASGVTLFCFLLPILCLSLRLRTNIKWNAAARNSRSTAR